MNATNGDGDENRGANADEEEPARATARPPADAPSAETPHAQSGLHVRSDVAAATTKMEAFKLAEVLARVTAEAEPASSRPTPVVHVPPGEAEAPATTAPSTARDVLTPLRVGAVVLVLVAIGLFVWLGR